MVEIHGDGGPLFPVPEDMTIEQFILDGQHPVRPIWNRIQPVLVEEGSGRHIGSNEIRARVHGVANALKIRWSIERDDAVCIFSPNHVDYVVAVWAVHRLSGVATTANPMYTGEELTHQLRLTKARMIITHPSVLPVALEAARAVGLPEDRIVSLEPIPGSKYPDVQDLVIEGLKQPQRYKDFRLSPGESKKKLALLSFSSGTTGKPKAVMISHYSIIVNVVQIAQHLRLNDDSLPLKWKPYRPGSVTYGVLPFYHAYGLHMVLFASIFLRSTVVVSPKFSLQRMLQSIQQYRVTHLYVVPPQAILLCKSPLVKEYDLTSVYALSSGAAPLSAELTERLVQLLPNSYIGQGYGMTEVATGVTFYEVGRLVGTPGSAGLLLPGIVARVVKADGSFASFNELGELQVKTPSMSLGYLDNPGATAETFVNGWLRTGDEVMINERKDVFVVDRIKELIKVRGFQVAPSELEGLLLDHPDVVDVCVVPVQDDFSGERPFAFVVPAPPVAERVHNNWMEQQRMREKLLKYVSEHKARYKHLAGVQFVDVIPKNPSGKLLRRVLRDRARQTPSLLSVKSKL